MAKNQLRLKLKKIIILFLLITSSLYSSLVGNGFIHQDLKILNHFDIDNTFLTEDNFQTYYNKLTRNYSSTYAKKLNNAELFIPQIKKILKENNIPSSFLYLAMAESNFILKAKSNRKAMGIWQFMPETGRIYGLEKNKFIDERMDIEKSTLAAVKYFKKLHKMFGKWYLVAIAYKDEL
jgi:membrane-bound lytic murein transglycosylase D